MKKIILRLLCVFIFLIMNGFGRLSAQAFCVSAEGLAYFQHYPEKFIIDPQNNDTLYHASPFRPGMRFEANYFLPGFNIPISAFNGAGVSYWFPTGDSAIYDLALKNGGSVRTRGMIKSRMIMPELRFGYEIPQTFNDFLIIHFGWGFGMGFGKQEYMIPEQSATFNYTSSDFTDATLEGYKYRQLNADLLAGVTYEFEHFFVMAQYSAYISLSNISPYGGPNTESSGKLRHGLTLGISLPFKRL